MQKRGLITSLWEFVRIYLVTVALIYLLAAAFLEVYTTGMGPVPQQPPEGYTVEQMRATLQWNKGTREEKIRLQVAMDDPSFTKPILDKKTAGKSHNMKDLKPGHTYYWRLVQGNKTSSVAMFKTSAYVINF